ncbi:uncharacterized protein LOC131008997 [Salvia miltiorrhiza]|uniref:uncharacterized protein LOC131008997 n=1 Tax=Salvia miltiorrhiza TaxID=226208 RepID=UPI0025AC1519|nr:uncharacterized protein LOC131008997 [Salvia miltiorrhiza]
MGEKIDNSLNRGNAPPVFRLHGENYHLMGSLMPLEGCRPKFAHLYIYDTENEVDNRLLSVRQKKDVDDLHAEIVLDIQSMLDECNILVKSFRMARNKISDSNSAEVKLRLLGKRGKDGRTYNLPSVSEVAVLIVGDIDEAMGDRDIIIECKNGVLKRINELHPSYLALQYPLIFPFGDDCYREDIGFSENWGSTSRSRVSPKEYFAFRLHERQFEPPNILYCRRLFQQFVVDAYTMVESGRLKFVRTQQKKLRAELYKGLADGVLRGDTDPVKYGKRVILPSSFTGGARYMIQNYQDAMAICGSVGYRNLFITFTCNPKWPEIVRYVQSRGLKAEDRPDIISRVFKVKLDNFIIDLRAKAIFGKVTAVIYTVEFQKRGLPHAHILLFLSKEDQNCNPSGIDKIISAEIPNEDDDPTYFAAVRDFMLHGPCGIDRPKSPCMFDGRCSKYFSKKYVDVTTVDESGYPVYRRRNNGNVILKNGVSLDNRYVVPHNRFLLMKYGGHVNVEWCNQSRSVKYLFKYINKGNDRVTTSFYQSNTGGEVQKCVDEVKLYYDCRYISPCEAMWRILGFVVQFKDPPVKRLSFHLPDEQFVVFSESDPVDVVLDRKTVSRTIFSEWMKANKIYPEGRSLTYAQYPTKFRWNEEDSVWQPRKKGYSIGRLVFIAPGSGELYYFRCLLNIVRGVTCYEEIRCVDGIQYDNFRDACFALGLLEDDKEYIDGIIEASHWASAKSLRSLFVTTLLSSESISRPEVVWNSCWKLLSDDVLYNRRKNLRHPDLLLSDLEIQNFALVEIEKSLLQLGRTLREFGSMPFLSSDFFEVRQNRLISD